MMVIIAAERYIGLYKPFTRWDQQTPLTFNCGGFQNELNRWNLQDYHLLSYCREESCTISYFQYLCSNNFIGWGDVFKTRTPITLYYYATCPVYSPSYWTSRNFLKPSPVWTAMELKWPMSSTRRSTSPSSPWGPPAWGPTHSTSMCRATSGESPWDYETSSCPLLVPSETSKIWKDFSASYL